MYGVWNLGCSGSLEGTWKRSCSPSEVNSIWSYSCEKSCITLSSLICIFGLNPVPKEKMSGPTGFIWFIGSSVLNNGNVWGMALTLTSCL